MVGAGRAGALSPVHQRPEETGRRRRFAFIDVTAGSADQFFRDAEYSDYHHMSPEGAGRFTAMLAAAIAAALEAEPAGSRAEPTDVAPGLARVAFGLHRGPAVGPK